MGSRYCELLLVTIAVTDILLSGGCSPDKSTVDEHPREGITSTSRTMRPDLSFAELEAEYADVVRAFPLKEQSGFVIQELLEAAQREDLATDADALIQRMPDQNLALYLFDVKYEDILSESVKDALALVSQTQAKFPDTPLSLLAFDKELLFTRANDIPAFLAKCQEILSFPSDDSRKRIVLLRRAEFLCSTGHEKECALDYLRFWTDYPDKVVQLGLPLTIQARLMDAGLFWEATALELATSPERLAQQFFREFSELESPSASGSNPLMSAYWNFTPNLSQLNAVTADLQGTSLDEIEFLGRTACVAMHLDDVSTAQQLMLRNGRALLAYFDEAHGAFEDIERLRDVHRVVFHDTMRVFSNYKMIETYEPNIEYQFNTREESQIGLALGRMEYDLAVASIPLGEVATDVEVDAVEKFAKTADIFRDRNAVINAYQEIVERYYDSDLAPEYLLKIGDVYKDTWNAPEKAVVTYDQIRESYSQSPHAVTALAKKALCLYELEKYEDAYLAGQEYVAEYPDGEGLVAMKMVSALAESGMGLSEEAEVHMKELAEQHRQSPLAPRALFWVASNKLAVQDYEGARTEFEELLERYPTSPYSDRAKNYLERLEAIEENSGA
jgi:TolA-binding protein